MTDFEAILRALVGGEVEFILVGGVAAAAHGSSRLTQDVDVVYRRTPANISRLVKCRCLKLRRLIEVKRAAGRPRDLEAVAELEALLGTGEGKRLAPLFSHKAFRGKD